MAHQAVKIIAGPWGSYNEKEIIDADTPAETISAWLADGAIIEVPDGAVVKLDDGALVEVPNAAGETATVVTEAHASGPATQVVPQPDGTIVRASDGTKIDAAGVSAQERFTSGVHGAGPITGTGDAKAGWTPTTGTVEAPKKVTVTTNAKSVEQVHQPATPASTKAKK